MSLYIAHAKKKKEEQETPEGSEKIPERLSTRGRLLVGEEDGEEKFVRVAKYPFINIAQAGLELSYGDFEAAKDLLSDQIGSIGPVGQLAMLAVGYRHDYDKWTPVPVIIGETLSTFMPGYRVLNDLSRMLDPYRRKQSTFQEAFTQIIPTTNEDLQEKLHGEKRSSRVPIEGTIKRKPGEKKGRTTTDRFLKNYWKDILLSTLTGIYTTRIDPEVVKAFIIRIKKNEEELKKSSKKSSFNLVKQAEAAEARAGELGLGKNEKFEVWDLDKTGDGSGSIIFLEDNSQIPVRSSKGKTTDEIIESHQKEIEVINRAAKEFDIDPGLMVDMALQEDQFKSRKHYPNYGTDKQVKGESSATGMFGIIDETWTRQVASFENKGYGHLLSDNPSRYNPSDNAMIAAFMLKKQMLDDWDAGGHHIKWSDYYSEEELSKYGGI